MAKNDKNSLLNIHYSRTMTSDNLSKAANYVGNYVLKGLGAFGKIATAPFVQQGPTSATIYKSKELLAKERTIENKSEELLGKAMTWVSPLNYGAALATGNGLNARKGEEEVASWSPAWQALGRAAELYVGPKAVKGVKATPRVVVNTAAKAGNKTARAYLVSKELNKGVKLNTKNGRIEVTNTYFNSPDKWYRITETPEKYGIMELGKNVTTHDAPQTHGTINGWRSSMLKAPITKSSEGFIKRPQKIELGIRRKNGQAHGNTSQAAKGKLWGGTTSGSNLFPEGIIEGQAPSMINYGIDRTNFVMTPWELVPNGGRVGFHTGEMPMSNLGWFQRTNKGTYTYEPIIPEKRISYQPKLLLDSPTSLKFFERGPAFERVNYSKYSVDATNPLERNLVFLHWNNRYPNSGLKLLTPEEITIGWSNEPVLKVGELPLSDRGLSISKVMERRLLKYPFREGIDPKYVVTAGRTSTSGIHGFMDLLRNLNTIMYMPLKNAGNIEGEAFAGIPYLKINPWRNKPYHLTLIHEGLSHPTDGVVELLRTPSGYKLLGNKYKDSQGITHVEGSYGKISWPEDLFDNKVLEKLIREDSRKGIEARSTNWEMISDLYALLAKKKGITFDEATNLPESEFNSFVESTLNSPEKVAQFMEKFDNLYLQDYAKVLRSGDSKLLGAYSNRIIKMILKAPSYTLPLTGGYTLYNLLNNLNNLKLEYRKQGGKMNILEFLKNGSGIHIKEKNKGSFTRWCGGNVTEECIRRGKNSPNPKIRKKATFAANVRKWKHKDGGTVYNGIKKHLEGAKLTFGLKLGNFANSDLGKSVISNGLSFLSDKLFNKSASSNLEIALAAQEKELSTIDPMQVTQMIEIAKNQYADSDNPNANGGDIFNSYIKNQITAPILARQLEEHKKRLAAINLLKNQAKSSAVGTFFNTLAQGGIEYLLNKYGKTEKAGSN